MGEYDGDKHADIVRTRVLRALRRVTRALHHSAFDLSATLQAVTDGVVEATSFRAATVRVTGPDGGLSTVSATGVAPTDVSVQVPVLAADGRHLGALVAADPAEGVAWGPHEREVLELFAASAAAAIEHSRVVGDLARAAMHDPLTGLANRRRLAEEVAGTGACGVLAIDLDGFELVNDLHGHAVGDEVLRAAGRRIVTAVRSRDLVVRLGGDEFLVLVHDEAGLDHTVRALEGRLVRAFAEPLAVSVGLLDVGASVGSAVGELESFVRTSTEADLTMYAAKRSDVA